MSVAEGTTRAVATPVTPAPLSACSVTLGSLALTLTLPVHTPLTNVTEVGLIGSDPPWPEAVSATVPLTFTASPSTAGPITGSLMATLTSTPTVGGLDSKDLSQPLSFSGTAYRLAVGSAPASVNMGNIPVGGSSGLGGQTVTVTNTAPADSYSDDLEAVASLSGSGIGIGGTATLNHISAGATGTLALCYNSSMATLGAISGTATLVYTSQGRVGSGLPDATPVTASQSVTVTGLVYSGQGTWGGSTSGNWSDFSKWNTPAGPRAWTRASSAATRPPSAPHRPARSPRASMAAIPPWPR